MHTKQITQSGLPLGQAKKVMIMVHGRGATAPSILELANHLEVTDFTLQAPQASQFTWYPYSFMAPQAQNEPGLSTALTVLGEMVQDLKEAGFQNDQIYFLGFSQGACLVSEFVARNANRYGGVFIYSGGLIGHELQMENYQGEFSGTPVLLACSDVDPHIPLRRVEETAEVFEKMGAKLEKRIYPNGAHTVYTDEIEQTNLILQAE